MLSEFEKWWKNTGYFKAQKLNILDAPVEKDLDFYIKSHIVKCNCGCQILEVERYDYKDGDEGFNIVVWNRGHDGNRICGWKEKFRWCWNIIRTGKPWADSIIATNHDAKELAKFILQNLPNEELYEETKN